MKFHARVRIKTWVTAIEVPPEKLVHQHDSPRLRQYFHARNVLHDRLEHALIDAKNFKPKPKSDWLWPQIRDTTRPAEDQWC